MWYARIGDGRECKNGRHASVYMGLTPKQYRSGGNVIVLGMDKKGGDKARRAALYPGALSVLSRLPSEPRTVKEAGLLTLRARAGMKRTGIATVRTAWAWLATGKSDEPILLS